MACACHHITPEFIAMAVEHGATHPDDIFEGLGVAPQCRKCFGPMENTIADMLDSDRDSDSDSDRASGDGVTATSRIKDAAMMGVLSMLG